MPWPGGLNAGNALSDEGLLSLLPAEPFLHECRNLIKVHLPSRSTLQAEPPEILGVGLRGHGRLAPDFSWEGQVSDSARGAEGAEDS